MEFTQLLDVQVPVEDTGCLQVDNTLDKAIFDLFNQEQFGTGAPGNLFMPDLPLDGASSDENEDPVFFSSSATSSYAEPLDSTPALPESTTGNPSKKRSAEDLDAPDYQREKRLQRNRESAALSRWRKKTTMESLSVKNRDLERTNARLNYLLACSNAEVQALRTQLVRYQSASGVGNMVPPPTSTSESAALCDLVYRTKYSSPSRNSLQLEYYRGPQCSLKAQVSPETRTSSLKQSQQVVQKRISQHKLLFLFLASSLVFLAPRKLQSRDSLVVRRSQLKSRLARAVELNRYVGRFERSWQKRRIRDRGRKRICRYPLI